jgi:hypothetical protein
MANQGSQLLAVLVDLERSLLPSGRRLRREKQASVDNAALALCPILMSDAQWLGFQRIEVRTIALTR